VAVQYRLAVARLAVDELRSGQAMLGGDGWIMKRRKGEA
jgi:hypothetical protein